MRLRQFLIYSVATATVALVSPVITPLVDVPSVARADAPKAALRAAARKRRRMDAATVKVTGLRSGER